MIEAIVVVAASTDASKRKRLPQISKAVAVARAARGLGRERLRVQERRVRGLGVVDQRHARVLVHAQLGVEARAVRERDAHVRRERAAEGHGRRRAGVQRDAVAVVAVRAQDADVARGGDGSGHLGALGRVLGFGASLGRVALGRGPGGRRPLLAQRLDVRYDEWRCTQLNIPRLSI